MNVRPSADSLLPAPSLVAAGAPGGPLPRALRRRALRPLVAALAAALPLQVLAQAVPRPASSAVPVPSASWRVSGTGGAAPVNRGNAAGGVDQTITQSSKRGIYQWQSFDIGDKSSVTFDMAQAGASALNRIGGQAPSQIFGKLTATNGGEIVLINANGILFGQGAQVNAGALTASALNISDSEYLSGFAQSLANPLNDGLNAAFRYDGAPEDFIDSKNFVRVDAGASLTTSSGGRVFLFARKVENAGSISTPDGQTVLAGGGSVYLKLPSSEAALYAAETNPNVSVLRGFLVEVGQAPGLVGAEGAGSASNLASGQISSPRGNTTLVGMAVNQMGRISATTSVSENGSIILRAQGAAAADNVSQTVRATRSGQLTLGAGSQTLITPDTRTDSEGETVRSTDRAGFVASHIDMAGQSVLFDQGASVVAPGATVNVRAESQPTYYADLVAGQGNTLAAGDPGARIVLREGATIDVSGTTGTVESVARNFVTTELLGSNDLKDAPVQKDGLLYRAKVTVDVREDSKILGSLDSYRDDIARTVEERLSSGGDVRLRAEGAVLTEAGSRINVSGGQVRYTEAQVRETRLLGSDGKSYSLNDAPADLIYTQATNLQKSSQASYDRWGVQVAYGTVSPTRTEAGYVEGRDAGTVKIAAPVVALQGGLQAGTVQGERQLSGEAARGSNGSLLLGALVNGGVAFNGTGYTGAVLRDFTLGQQAPVLADGWWEQPLQAELPAQSGLQARVAQEAGFDRIEVAANGAVALDAGPSTFQLQESGALRLLSLGDSVTLASSVRGAHASVELNSKQLNSAAESPTGELKTRGLVRVADGVSVDLSGHWVNASGSATPLSTAGTAGGSFTATGYGVQLGAGSLVDVSGGASVSSSGVVSGASAGSITLRDYTRIEQADAPSLWLGGELRGYSAQATGGVAGGGGSLSLQTPTVWVGARPSGEPAPGLVLAPDFFSQGGFGRISVDGRLGLEVAAGTDIDVQQAHRQLPVVPASGVLPPSGTPARDVLREGLATGVRSGAVQVTLSSSGDAEDASQGVLRLGPGAVISTPAQSSVTLSAAHQLFLDGTVRAPAGTVALQLKGSSGSLTSEDPNLLWLGQGSRVDVAGTVVRPADTTDGLLKGQVLGGGKVSVDAGNASSLVFAQGAVLDARGTTATMDVTERADGGVRTERRTVASEGGEVTFAGNSDLWLEGRVALAGGSGAAAGGSLGVTLRSGVTDPNQPLFDRRELQVVRNAPAETPGLSVDALAGSTAITGRARVGGDWIQASGAANLRLASSDTLQFEQGVTLDLPGQLSLVARGVGSRGESPVQLGAGRVFMGWNATDIAGQDASKLPGAPAASAGTGSLSLQARDSLVLDGHLTTQGLAHLSLQSGGDLQLRSREVVAGGPNQGSLTTPAELTLQAAQIYPATDTRFSIEAARVSIGAGDAGAARPLSAGGSLVIRADEIVQGGVLRAPLGRIELQAAGRLELLDGSETSVTAAGQDLLYGRATSTTWTRPAGGSLQAPPDKQIVLQAGELTTRAGSTLDLRGGGDLIATEFVPGSGGSTDILAGGNGAYAILPGTSSLAGFDPSLAASAAAQGRQIEITRTVRMSNGSVLPAGRYTLLPARFAVLPGAFLVRPETTSPTLASGTVVSQTDGSALVGARLADAGSSRVDALASTWEVLDRATALRYSEVRSYHADEVFAAQAAKAGTRPPALPADGGSLVVRTTQASLEGQGLFSAAQGSDGKALGQGGRAEFVADRIQVDAAPGALSDGVLHLAATTLNQLGAQTVVLGASSGQATAEEGAGTPLTTSASTVTLAQGSQALTVPDLLAAATGSVTIEDGAVFRPSADGVASSSPVAYALTGDGAAMRVTAAPGAGLERSEASRVGGSLRVGDGVRFDAAGGSLALDSTGGTSVAATARLAAADLSLSGGVVRVGGSAQAPGQLSLTPGLLAQAAGAERLTLRGYERIDFTGGSALGSAALDSLVLDSPLLRAFGLNGQPATATAGTLTVTNTTGGTAAGMAAGNGRLALQATQSGGGSGVLRMADGQVAFGGLAALDLRADQAVALAGEAEWRAQGTVTVTAPVVMAERAAAQASLVASGSLQFAATAPVAGAAAPVSADGGLLHATGSSVSVSGRILLPAGEISLSGAEGVQLLQGAQLDTAGRTVTLDGQAVDLSGGSIGLHSASGDIGIGQGVRLDVSGAGSTGAGGALSFSAPEGGLSLGGNWLGAGGSQAPGARLSIDTASALEVGRIAAKAEGEFTSAIVLRQRQGDLQVGAEATLRAEALSLSADAGSLVVRGTLDASGAQGGRVALDAGQDLTLAAGSKVLVQSTAADAQGGRVDLNAVQGRLRLAEGSLINLSGGPRSEAALAAEQAAAASTADAGSAGVVDPQAPGGRLGLRAGRIGPHEVNIAELAGTIEGASRIDVQAVEVYEGVSRIVDSGHTEGRLSTTRIATDAARFVGSAGEHADALVDRLAGGDAALADRMKIHAEAEVRAAGDLTVVPSDTWFLPTPSVDVTFAGGDGRHVGDLSVTLRAAGSLNLHRGIESGFDFFGAPQGNGGGSIRLVAGADLSAASATAVVASPAGAGKDLTFAAAEDRGRRTQMLVRTTTGDIELAASGDISLFTGRTAIYTAGAPADAAAALAAERLGVNGFSGRAFNTGAGDVTLTAGGQVLSRDLLVNGAASGAVLGLGALAQQAQSLGADGAPTGTGWWAELDTLQRGVASFGGGDIRVEAGTDVVNLVAYTPSSGYSLVEAGEPTPVRRFAGGEIEVRAGRDVVGGLYAAGGSRLSLTAGRDITRQDVPGSDFPGYQTPGVRLFYESTRMRLDARRDLTVGTVSSRFLKSDSWLTGLDGAASLQAVARGGSLAVTAGQIEDQADVMLLPGQVSLAAPSGSIGLGTATDLTSMRQRSAGDASFTALSGDGLSLGTNLWVDATQQSLGSFGFVQGETLDALQLGTTNNLAWTDGNAGLDASSRSPVRLVGAGGDVTVSAELGSARPVRLVAGRDILLTDQAIVRSQHQPQDGSTDSREITLLQAGRDILFGNGILRVAGGGDAVLMAGRDIDLGSANSFSDGSGVMAIGNTDNGLLPSRSAAVTLVAGLRADGSDYGAAVRQGFHALGAAALAGRAGDVYALLSRTDGGVPSLGGDAARQFEALDTTGQLSAIRNLLGDAAYQQALAGYVRGLQGNGGLTDAQALAAFDSQSEARRAAAPGSLLAAQVGTLPAARRQAFIAQVAASDTPRTAQALQAWMQLKTGRSLTLADAVSAFESLPLERQVSWLNQVLVDEVRTQGRAAASASGFEAEAAYLRGYQAINTVFAVDRPDGEIRLPTTQVKSLQAGSTELVAATGKERAIRLGAITMMAPGGSVNAGELGSTSQSTNNLGIVTVAGGDIAAVVRDDFLVNQSRVFSLAEGDILLWASAGDIDAGRGAKTVTGTPAPQLRLDPATGKLVLDTSGAFTGSGIAVLTAGSDLDLYAPAGAIDAGEAGIRATGNVFLGAQVVRGADNLQVGGNAVGAPVAPSTVSVSAGLASAAASLSQPEAGSDDEDERRRKRLARRNLLLEFLGFGRG